MPGVSSTIRLILFAKSSPPSPPLATTSLSELSTPISSQYLLTISNSVGVSVGKRLMATTTGSPYFWTFSACVFKFSQPVFKASRFSIFKSSFSTPPWYFKALIVATKTAALGFNPAWRHLMLTNFSAPKSAAKPASVTTYGASLRAKRVALTLFEPWAMLPKGPQCTKTGVCSQVCTRFGFKASFRITHKEPIQFNSRA